MTCVETQQHILIIILVKVFGCRDKYVWNIKPKPVTKEGNMLLNSYMQMMQYTHNQGLKQMKEIYLFMDHILIKTNFVSHNLIPLSLINFVTYNVDFIIPLTKKT